MAHLYHPDLTPIDAVQATLARWYQHYLRNNGHEPPTDITDRVRRKIERIASRRDRKWADKGWR